MIRNHSYIVEWEKGDRCFNPSRDDQGPQEYVRRIIAAARFNPSRDDQGRGTPAIARVIILFQSLQG